MSGLFAVNANQSLERYLAVQMDSLVAALRVKRDGEPVIIGEGATDPRFFQPASGWYWQIETADYLIRSRSMWDKSFGGGRFVPITEDEKSGLMIISKTVLPEIGGGTSAGTRFTLSANLDETERSINRFRRIMLLSMLAMAAGLFGALYWRMKVAFAPLNKLRAETAGVKSGLKSRIEGKFPYEVAPLAQEINLLLRQNEKTIQNVRRNVGNLAHALKTPLTVILNSLGKNSEGKTDNPLRTQAEQMHQIINRYLSRAAATGGSNPSVARSSPAEEIGKIASVLRSLYPRLRLEIKTGEERTRVRADKEDLQEMVGNLMENACKWAKSAVFVSVRKSGAKVTITVEDDGVGIPKSQLKKALTRGKRLDETTAGSGIGLAIVADAVTLAGGKLKLGHSAKGGLKASIQLPSN